MSPIFFALISFLGWGTGDVFGTIATRKIGGFSTVFWMFALRSVFMLTLLPVMLNDLSKMNLNIFLICLGLGAIKMIGEISYFEALRINSASLVGTIGATFSSVVIILSIVFLGETITINQTLTILIIFAGLILCTLNFNDLKKSNFTNKGTILSFIATLSWGVYFTFIKIPIKQAGWFWPSYTSFLAFPLIYIYLKLNGYKLNKLKSFPQFLPVLLVALLIAFGDFSFNFATSIGLTPVVAPIAGAYPVLFVSLAFLIFKDPVTKQQILGISTTLTGIVLLSFFSVS